MRSEGDPLAVAGPALAGTNALPFAQPYNFRAFCCATLLRAIRALPAMRELRENPALTCRNGGMSSPDGHSTALSQNRPSGQLSESTAEADDNDGLTAPIRSLPETARGLV